MAGHSKWKNIKHKKAATDAKKAKEFSKLNKEITVSARLHGGELEHNPQLRLLLQKAKQINMPQENAMRAIKKGTGTLAHAKYESHTYEGYGPHGIAVIVETLTDNKNRAVAEVRSTFTKYGGKIAENGAVNWMFERCGIIRGHNDTISEDTLLESLLDYGIKDISHEHNTWHISCEPTALEQVKQAASNVITIHEAHLEWIPTSHVHLTSEQEQKACDFLEIIEDLEDVQNIYTNLA